MAAQMGPAAPSALGRFWPAVDTTSFVFCGFHCCRERVWGLLRAVAAAASPLQINRGVPSPLFGDLHDWICARELAAMLCSAFQLHLGG